MEANYDTDLIVTEKDFIDNGIAKITNSAVKNDYNELGGVFRHAALDQQDENPAAGKICWLLHEVCTLAVSPVENPYGPAEHFCGVPCSKGIDDFTDQDMLFFESIVPRLTNPLLGGRLADMIWIRNKNYTMALKAINFFSQLPLERDSWVLQNHSLLWERTIILAIIFAKNPEANLESIKQRFLDEFFAMPYGKDTLHFWGSICSTLRRFKIDKILGNKIIAKILQQATEAHVAGNIPDYQYCNQLALIWQKEFQSEEAVVATINAEAESLVEEARNAKNEILAAMKYEAAIREYRKIPAGFRSQYDVASKIHDSRRLMRQKYLASTASSKEIKIYFKDLLTEEEINECLCSAKTEIAGKNMEQALAGLFCSFPGIDEEKKWKDAERSISGSIAPILLCGRQVLGGRVTASAPVVDPADLNSKASKDRIRYEILRFYPLHISSAWSLSIAPALEQFNSEHKISEEYLLKLCESSQTVPVGRAPYWAKGLLFGFQGDFSSAIHILVPQIENWIRELMQDNGLNTSTFNSDTGIETENGLSSLLNTDEISGLLDKNLLFELKSLLTSPPGPNLRNEIAHGLIEFEKANSPIGAYLWWLALKLMLNGNAEIHKLI